MSLQLPTWRVHVSTWLRFFVGNRLGPYHAMPQHVIDGLLRLAAVESSDVVVDVGCGDGRVLLEAARQCRIARGVGLEMNPALAALARLNLDSFRAQHPHLSSQLSIVEGDARRADLSSATVLTLYLSERGNRQLKPLLGRQLCLRSNARVASFCFPIPGWTPARQSKVSGIPLLLYTRDSIDRDLRREIDAGGVA